MWWGLRLFTTRASVSMSISGTYGMFQPTRQAGVCMCSALWGAWQQYGTECGLYESQKSLQYRFADQDAANRSNKKPFQKEFISVS